MTCRGSFITGNIIRLQSTGESFTTGVTEPLVPQIVSDYLKRLGGSCKIIGAKGIEIPLTITSRDLHLFARDLDRKTKWIKFN